MRTPGENATGRVPGRRRSPPGRAASPRQGRVPGNATPGNAGPGNAGPGNTVPGNTVPGNTVPGNTVSGNTGPGEPGAGRPAASEPSLFAPGYSGGREARPDPRPGSSRAAGARADSGRPG